MAVTSPLQPHRWSIVAASALILAITMGSIVNGISAYIVPMQDAFGWERGEIALINTSGILGLAFGGLVMGAQADRRGARPVVIFGVIALGFCYLLSSLATALWHYYALMFVAGFFGAGAIFPPVLALVGNWFPVGAGLAIGIVSGGQALGQGSAPFVSSILIQHFGIHSALAITGAIMLVVTLPLAMLLRQPETVKAQGRSSVEVDQGYPPARLVIPSLCLAVLLCCTCMSIPLMHLVPLVQDRGVALDDASSVIFVMMMVAIVGRVAFGKLADMIGALPAYMTATAWMGLLVYGFTQIQSLQYFFIYAIIYGFGYAGVMTGVLVSTASLTPPSRRASALAIVTLFGWLGHANGGYLGGALFDYSGEYGMAYLIAAASAALNLIIVGMLYMKVRSSGPDALAA